MDSGPVTVVVGGAQPHDADSSLAHGPDLWPCTQAARGLRVDKAAGTIWGELDTYLECIRILFRSINGYSSIDPTYSETGLACPMVETVCPVTLVALLATPAMLSPVIKPPQTVHS